MDRLARRLGVTRAEQDNKISSELLGEAVREVVFRYTLRGEAPSPVHVQSITNQVRRELAPIWPALARSGADDWSELGGRDEDEESQEPRSAESPIRRSLEILATVGDLQHVGSGYWLPTPIRLVHLADSPSAKALLIGGAPLYQLRLDGYVSVRICGNVRALPLRVLPESVREDDTAWQSLDDWLGSPSEPLHRWASQFLQRAATELSPSHSEVSDFEIYDPERHPRDAQFFRWTPARLYRPSAERLYLSRTVPQGGAGPRRYWLGRLAYREGAARSLSEYAVSGSDSKRLQYAFDDLESTPTRGSVIYDQESAKITLWNYLPGPEFRLVTAVGEECSPRPGRLPMTYRIPRDVAEPVLDRITGLGIQWR